MALQAKQIMGLAFGVTIFAILAVQLIMPNLNTLGATNVTGLGLTQAGWQGIVLIIVIAVIFGVAYKLIDNVG